MGLLDAPAVDFRGKPLSTFDPRRDLPNLLAWHDATTLAGAVGSSVTDLLDLGPLKADLYQPSSTARPVIAAGPGGRKVIDFASGKWLFRAASFFGLGPFTATAGWAKPLTIVYVGKYRPGSGTADRMAVGSNTAVSAGILGNRWNPVTKNAGATPLGLAGEPINDDQWHIVVNIIGAASGATWVDGVLTGASSTNAGTEALSGLSLGGNIAGAAPMDGLVGESLVFNSELTLPQIADVTAWLAKKWGLTTQVREQRAAYAYRDTTSSNGQNIRVFLPDSVRRGVGTNVPVLLWSHQSAGTEQIAPGGYPPAAYPLAHAAINEGWIFAASRMHGENWGNTTGQADVLDLYNHLAPNYPVGPVILCGASMGGLATAHIVASKSIPNIKGAFTIDGVVDLAYFYNNAASTYQPLINTAFSITAGTLSGAIASGVTSLPTTASFPTVGTQIMVGYGTANVEIVTTTAASTGTAVAVTATAKAHASGDNISDFPTKTAGFDPITRAASAYGSTPWRLYASTADATVPKGSHADPMVTKLTGTASEVAAVAHLGGHLDGASGQPRDVVAFVKRCLSA